MSGFIHGEGTFEFTCDSDVFLSGVQKGDVYKGSWDHNLSHGQVLFTQRRESTYEGSFLKGVMTGKGTFRSGRDCLDLDLVFPWESRFDPITGKQIPPGGHICIREYEGEFFKGHFHGHGTFKFSLYVDAWSRFIDQEDIWDVYTGNFRFGSMDGAG